jgi:hypothetical protein
MNITLHRSLMVCVLAGALALSVALVAAKDVSAAPSPALVGGATQISGVGFYPVDVPDATCEDPEGKGASYALVMYGDLEGCLYTFALTDVSSPSGTYRETGREIFVASDGSGTFATTYRFEAKYEVNDPATEIFGRCQHPIVKGSGTGVFEGVSGILFFKDVIEAGTDPYFPYRGHLRY